MDPTNFDQSNMIFGPPDGMTEDQCRSLFAFQGSMSGGTPVVITCWKPTKDDLECINRGGRVWLYIMGDTQPPVIITTENPFGGH